MSKISDLSIFFDMSLTSELKNSESPIRRWFDVKRSHLIDNIINHHNQVLSNSSIIRPQEQTNFPVVGNAICYALRKYIAQTINDEKWFCTSLAWYGARYLELVPLFDYCISSNKIEDEAIRLVILAALEQVTRNSKEINPILQVFHKNYKVESLILGDELRNDWIPTFIDINNIVEVIPTLYNFIFDDASALNLVKSNNFHNQVICNATFELSDYLSGADAQIVIDGIIIDVRTSAKRRPFTYENFLQQLSYCLLDTKDEYQIHTLVWIYTRHSVSFKYPLSKLFSNLNQTRKEFKEMILTNYGNEDDDIE